MTLYQFLYLAAAFFFIFSEVDVSSLDRAARRVFG